MPASAFRAWDGTDGSSSGDNGINTATSAFSSADASGIIEVRGVNDAPLNNVPAAQATPEAVPLTFNTTNGNLISISDVDGDSNDLEVSLLVTNGVLTLGGTTGLTFTLGDGTTDASMTFTGQVGDINAALDGLVYTPEGRYAGAATLRITSSELVDNGSGGLLSDTDVIDIAVTPDATNDAPLNTLPGAQSVDEDATLVLSEANGNAHLGQ